MAPFRQPACFHGFLDCIEDKYPLHPIDCVTLEVYGVIQMFITVLAIITDLTLIITIVKHHCKCCGAGATQPDAVHAVADGAVHLHRVRLESSFGNRNRIPDFQNLNSVLHCENRKIKIAFRFWFIRYWTFHTMQGKWGQIGPNGTKLDQTGPY